LGGACLNEACIPARALTASARLLSSIRNGARFGIEVAEPGVDVNSMHERKDTIIASLRMGTEELLRDHGVTIVRGRGKLADPHTVVVAGDRLKADRIIICTGSTAALPLFDGADLPGVMGTAEAMELRKLPERMAIIGNHPWGLEATQYFQALGCRVTLIECAPQVVPGADREVSARFGKVLHDGGVTVKRAASVQAIQGSADGLLVKLGNGKGEVETEMVLAARRLPNSIDLGLRELGVRMDGATVCVNERMETSLRHVYAAGDVTGGPRRSHKSSGEGLVAAENAMGLRNVMDTRTLPHCFFTTPEIAWVGLTEEQSKTQGEDVAVGKAPLLISPFALIHDQTSGMIKIVAGKRYGKILGVHIMAPGAIDLINTAVIAMLAEATVQQLMRVLPAHPSLGETLVDAAMDIEQRSLHMPKW
jgi:dihydrolipoamide dehydrogenase